MMETSPVAEVDTLFQQLIKMYGLPVSAEGANDGTYTGATPYDAFDYRHEVKKDGKGKQEDEEYCEEMLLSTQNMMEVDAVSGASYSLHRFRLAMTIALMKAII